jgi:hypothetical protein
MEWIVNLFWRLVFFWKKRTGWIDLKQEIEVTGTVINAEVPGLDGDGNFDVELDPGQERWITGFGGRLTFEPGAGRPSLHCEVEPWASPSLKGTFTSLRVGQRVRVRGSWGFDGVHIGVAELIEVLAAIVRHGPNVHDGWFEIHPVKSIELL